MTVLVDTGVLHADHDWDATRHGAAGDALEAVERTERLLHCHRSGLYRR